MVKPASRIRFVPFLLAFGGCNVLAGNDEPTLVSADAGTTDAPPALDSSGPDASGTADASDASSTVDARSDASTLCNAAPCGATEIQSNEPSATGIAADAEPDGYVYWSHYGGSPEIWRSKKDGTGRQRILDTSTLKGEPMQLLLGGGLLYWVQDDSDTSTSVHWSNPDGTSHHAVDVPYPTVGFGWAIVADSQAVYGSSREPEGIWRLTFGSTTPQILFAPAPDAGQTDAWDLAAQPGDGGLVFWCDEQVLGAIDKNGTGYRQLLGPNEACGSMTLSVDGVYFSGSDSQSILRVDFSGGCGGISPCPQVILGESTDDVRTPHRMLVDGASLYWANFQDDVMSGTGSRVMRSRLDGSGVTVLAELPGHAYDLAVDSEYVYVTIQYDPATSSGAVWRMSK